MAAIKPDVIIISSDDEDDYRGLDDHDSDKQELDDVEKSNAEECLDNCDRSDSLSQGGNDLHELSLFECKTYLRKHGMRVSGTKEECMRRIKEHERLKDGSGESLYPSSSFSINCTGDACRGDVVLFKQNMYDSQRNIIGIRTVAGRIANESYGASTQQHTFSVEVLWSKRSKKLNPLSILLVKGRNLYKFGTFRQPWESEAERSKVLREKHKRGREARKKRKLRETDFYSGNNRGTKRHKVSHRGPFQSKPITCIDTPTHVLKNAKAHNQAVWFQNAELKRSIQPTNHFDSNSFMYFDRTLLPNNLLPLGYTGYSHNNNGQQGPNQAFSQPPDHHHHHHHHRNYEPPFSRLTDKQAKSRFPKSSFSINCTGDARIGDVVLFKQPVYLGKNNKGKKRTIAGKIVNVRKCESKDKHKFMIRVLWATHSLNLHRRFTLPVRSHNLYKFGTFRQPWKNEANRSKMLEEKDVPVTRKRKLKKTDIASNKNKGAKRRKVSHNGTSRSKQPIQKAKHKSSKKKGASATPVKGTKAGHQKKTVQLQKTKVKKSKQQTVHLKPNSNSSVSSNPNQNLNQNPNPISSTTPNSHPIPYTRQNLNPYPYPYPDSNLYPNRTLNMYSHPNPHPHLNLHTNFNPPLGYVPNQPPAWFFPNQAPFGFPGFGGQWGSNHVFIQPPGGYHTQPITQSLVALWYQQQPR